MRYQIEITTRCNYGCTYCAGRGMPQVDMTWERFGQIVETLRLKPRARVNLQGEGEPTLHPDFWRMVDLVTQAGHVPYIITNGATNADVDKIRQYLPRVGVSLDTLDVKIATRIQRFNLPKVLAWLESLISSGYDPRSIDIMTVDFGQPLQELQRVVAGWGCGHTIQPRQTKTDYAKLAGYTVAKLASTRQPRACIFVSNNIMEYYTVTGQVLPCYCMKDPGEFTTRNALADQLQQGIVPNCCAGCRNLKTLEEKVK